MVLRDKITFNNMEVLGMARRPVPEPVNGNFLTVAELATYFAVTDQTIRAWIKDEDMGLPYGQFGRHLRFDRSQIEEWIDARWHDGSLGSGPKE